MQGTHRHELTSGSTHKNKIVDAADTLPVDDVLAVQKPQRQTQLHDVKAHVQHIGKDLGMFLQQYRRTLLVTNGIQKVWCKLKDLRTILCVPREG